MNHHVRIKICGVTTPDDARAAAHLGADAVGLNFYPASPRYLTHATAATILQTLPPFITAVGVFVKRPFSDIADEVRALPRLGYIQWHGQEREPASMCPLPLIAAFNVRGPESLHEIRRYLDLCRTDGQLPAAILVDGHIPGQHGGTGRTAPWDLLASFQCEVPLILAGGLTPENVTEAVRVVRPYGVDVASGVESAPGHKDVEKMGRFIENARSALQ